MQFSFLVCLALRTKKFKVNYISTDSEHVECIYSTMIAIPIKSASIAKSGISLQFEHRWISPAGFRKIGSHGKIRARTHPIPIPLGMAKIHQASYIPNDAHTAHTTTIYYQ